MRLENIKTTNNDYYQSDESIMCGDKTPSNKVVHIKTYFKSVLYFNALFLFYFMYYI